LREKPTGLPTFSVDLKCSLLQPNVESRDYFSFTKSFLLGKAGKENERSFDYCSPCAFLAWKTVENLFKNQILVFKAMYLENARTFITC